MFKSFILTFYLLLLTFYLPLPVFAANCGDVDFCANLNNCPASCPKQNINGIECDCRAVILKIGASTITSPVGFTNIGSVISKLLPYIFVISGLILFFIIVMKGFEFLTSAGDSKKVESAKQGLTAAIVGFLIIFVSYWLLQILEVVFHIKVL